MEEIWIPTYIFPNNYEVSNLGNVRKVLSNRERVNSKFVDGYRPLSNKPSKNGYVISTLFGERIPTHRLVFESFVCEIPDGYEIDHIDTNRSNNRLDNLRMCTRKENQNNPNTIKNKIESGCYKKIVEQYSLDGELIAVYPSILETAKIIQGNRQPIRDCCNGKIKTAYGYKWKFKKELG